MRPIHLAALAAAALAACQPQPPKPKTPDQLACADPAAPSRVNFRVAVDWELPRPLPGYDMFENPDAPEASPLAVRRRVAISGRNIERAAAGFDSATGQRTINILLTKPGVAQLAAATDSSRNGDRLALVMDDKLVAAPYFGAPIAGAGLQLPTALSAEDSVRVAEALEEAAKGCVPVPPKSPSPP